MARCESYIKSSLGYTDYLSSVPEYFLPKLINKCVTKFSRKRNISTSLRKDKCSIPCHVWVSSCHWVSCWYLPSHCHWIGKPISCPVCTWKCGQDRFQLIFTKTPHNRYTRELQLYKFYWIDPWSARVRFHLGFLNKFKKKVWKKPVMKLQPKWHAGALAEISARYDNHQLLAPWMSKF